MSFSHSNVDRAGCRREPGRDTDVVRRPFGYRTRRRAAPDGSDGRRRVGPGGEALSTFRLLRIDR